MEPKLVPQGLAAFITVHQRTYARKDGASGGWKGGLEPGLVWWSSSVCCCCSQSSASCDSGTFKPSSLHCPELIGTHRPRQAECSSHDIKPGRCRQAIDGYELLPSTAAAPLVPCPSARSPQIARTRHAPPTGRTTVISSISHTVPYSPPQPLVYATAAVITIIDLPFSIAVDSSAAATYY